MAQAAVASKGWMASYSPNRSAHIAHDGITPDVRHIWKVRLGKKQKLQETLNPDYTLESCRKLSEKLGPLHNPRNHLDWNHLH